MDRKGSAEIFGKNLRLIRGAVGINQKDMGAALGISTSIMNRYEQGANMPRTDFLQKIFKFFDVPVVMLTSGNDGEILNSINVTQIKVRAYLHLAARSANLSEDVAIELAEEFLRIIQLMEKCQL